MRLLSGLHLTYCTNIHPAAGWDAVRGTLARVAPALKARLSPDAPFGLGLRLSGAESAELLEGTRLDDFAAWLDDSGLYVALLNGFPHGAFHGRPVKADVFSPDWRDPERVAYTLRLLRILARLLPAGLDGGISTCPFAYRAWLAPDDRHARGAIARNVGRVLEAMARLKRETGASLHLDVEPEPDGLAETCAELAGFVRREAEALGDPGDVREHLRACLDTCHGAVVGEAPRAAVAALDAEGLRVGRVQVSAALAAPVPAGLPELEPFAESVYLHQCVERGGPAPRRFPDLPQALAAGPSAGASEWRTHFHVPLFLDRYGALAPTRAEIREAFALLRERPYAAHLEIETYTWDVLPPAYRLDLVESIHREFRWTLAELAAAGLSPA